MKKRARRKPKKYGGMTLAQLAGKLCDDIGGPREEFDPYSPYDMIRETVVRLLKMGWKAPRP